MILSDGAAVGTSPLLGIYHYRHPSWSKPLHPACCGNQRFELFAQLRAGRFR
jgi:hypothetical protein